jgi:hypothetical protein
VGGGERSSHLPYCDKYLFLTELTSKLEAGSHVEQQR